MCIIKRVLKFKISRCRYKVASKCTFPTTYTFQTLKIFTFNNQQLHFCSDFFQKFILNCLTDKWRNGSDVERSERTQCCQWQHISPAKQSATTRHSGLVKGRLRNSRQKPGIRLKTLDKNSLIHDWLNFSFDFRKNASPQKWLRVSEIVNLLVNKCKCWFLALCSLILPLQDLVIKEVRWSTN